MLTNALRAGSHPARRPELPEGERVYAIGDVHGRLDLFEDMIAAIEADDTGRNAADTTIVLLGDLVDRGPDSAGVIDAARRWAERRNVRMLMGNHEEMFLRAIRQEAALRQFLRVGGKETVLSYGLDRGEYTTMSLSEVHERLRTLIPAEDIAFMEQMEHVIAMGDYVFAHAGIDPAKPVAEQVPGDLHWIREPFLSHGERMDVCVVHGHTIREMVDIHAPRQWPNRIGIDTGAFRTGKLTAIGLQGEERWFMETTTN